MGPTNLSHSSRAISLQSVEAFGGGPDEDDSVSDGIVVNGLSVVKFAVTVWLT